MSLIRAAKIRRVVPKLAIVAAVAVVMQLALLPSAAFAVGTAPAITSANSANFIVGQAGAFTVTTTGSPSAAITEIGTPPSGLTFIDNGDGTAALSGTPSGSGGYYSIFLTANNGVAPSATQTLTIRVGQPPAFTNGATATFVKGTAGSFTVTTSGFPTVSTILESGVLPGGVTFTDNGNGMATIAGTPSGTAGSFPVTLTATNGVSPDATQNLTIQVNESPAITSNPTDQTVAPGTSVSFIAAASGVPTPTVQWQRSTDGGASFPNIAGATSTTYTFTVALGDDGNLYRAVFANGVGSPATTTQAALYIGTAPAFTSADHTSFAVGVSGTFAISTNGVPSATLSRTGAQFPAWLTLTDNGDGTGSLTGTAPAGSAGQYQFTLKGASGFSPSASQVFTLYVDAPPVITSGNHTTFTVGSAGSFAVTSTAGFPTTTAFTETGSLPAGVGFTDNGDGTATLAGTPDAGTGGVYVFTVQATAVGAINAPATQSFTLTVEAPPVITSTDHTTFAAGQAGSFTVTTSPGYPTAATLAQTGALPAGVSFTDNGDGTATFAGTPQTGSGGRYSVAVRASNGSSADAVQSFTLTVQDAPVIASANGATFTLGAASSFTVTTLAGYPTATTLTETGSLPAGVSFTDNGDGTATLAGTPSVGGDYPLTMRASNSVSPDAQQNFTLTVSSTPVITSADHTTFAVGSAGSFTVTTSPGTPSATTLTESGALPAGMSFTDNGDGTATIAGTPAIGTGASYVLTLTATNGVLPNSIQSFTMTVTELPAITSADTETFTVGNAGTFTVLTKAGFPTAATLTETGSLPAGLNFTDNGDGTATLSGTPQARTGGSYPLTITATNSAGHVDQAFTLNINESGSITSADHATFTIGSASSFTVTTAGGHPTPPTLTVAGTPPTGVTFVDNGDGTATISGTPTQAGTFSLQITESNGASADTVQNFVLTIDGPPSITSDPTAAFVSGITGSFTITTLAGVPASPVTVTVSGALPSGLTFTDNGDGTATLSGITTADPSAFPLTVTASNGVSPDAVQSLTVKVESPQPVTLPTSLPLSTGTLQGVSAQTTVGETLHISGGGFAAGAPVTIAVYSTPVTVGTATAAADGTFTATIQVPSLLGAHTFVAAGVRADGSIGYLEAALTISAAASGISSGEAGPLLAHTGQELPFWPFASGLGVLLAGLGLYSVGRRRKNARI